MKNIHMIEFLKRHKDSILFFLLISTIVGGFIFGVWYIDTHRRPPTLDNTTGRRIKIKECEYCKEKEYMLFQYED